MRFILLFVLSILVKSAIGLSPKEYERSINGLNELRESLVRQKVSPQTANLIDMIFNDLTQLAEESSSKSGKHSEAYEESKHEPEYRQEETSQVYEAVTEAPPPTTGTTPNFKEIFIGRCHYFINVLHADTCFLQPYLAKKINCTQLVDEFLKVVIGKDPCEITEADYGKYLKCAAHPIPVNRSLLYSESLYDPAHQLSRARDYWTLEDTLTGYLNNELLACSKHGCDGLVDVCPEACVLKNNSFWNAASRSFARAAEGIVNVMLNGTDPKGAFVNDSNFASNQLPNLNAEKVKTLKVLLIHRPGQKVIESCSYLTSLSELKMQVEARGIAFECSDDPEEVKLLLCFENPESNECMRLQYLALKGISKAGSKTAAP